MPTLINPMRRERMRSFTQHHATFRKWTVDERTWLMRAYMEHRESICPVCDARVLLDDSGTGLQCPGCGNSSRS